VPAVTAFTLGVDQTRRLAHHPRIVGMKDSSGEPERLDRLADVIADGFTVFAGASRALLASHHAGAWGAITASANYALTDVSLASRGDAGAQQRLTALAAIVEAHGVPGTKVAADLTGLRAGPPRPPLAAVDPNAAQTIADQLRTAGIVSTK
jgi:4-hydroxy-tetrahydrodipicolinate synthase/4-hydroxy-2-oxoglutarate aldolase